jgi:hypothetical protein
VSSPEIDNVVGAEVFIRAEGSILGLDMVRDSWPTGVMDYGTSAERLGRNPGDPNIPVLEDPGWTAG